MIGLGALLGLGLSQRLGSLLPPSLRRLLLEVAGGGRLLAENGSPLLLE